jgi:hypothetical protein
MARAWIPVAGLVVAAACGKGPTQPEPQPTPTGPTVTITSTGASPRAIEIPVGGRLTIINNDGAAHDMTSDPHPSHEDCPPLNDIGFLNPGQRRTSGNLVEARVCGMHDHLHPLATSLQLRLTIK